MLPGRQKVDISSFSEQERELFAKYGKVPTSKNLLSQKLKERKYFDSGDYAMQKAGVVSHSSAVGTAIPSPADIPHASPQTTTTSGSISISPTSGSPMGQQGFGGNGSPERFGTSPSKSEITVGGQANAAEFVGKI